jgi:hypothetical protein
MVAVFQRYGAGYTERERLEFGPQSPDISWGRYPDGSAELRIMNPTPEASNVLLGTVAPDVQVLEMFPNPFSEQLSIVTQNVAKPYGLMLVNTLGQVVYEANELYSETFVLQRGGLASGIYSVMIVDVQGNRYVGKVVVGKE